MSSSLCRRRRALLVRVPVRRPRWEPPPRAARPRWADPGRAADLRVPWDRWTWASRARQIRSAVDATAGRSAAPSGLATGRGTGASSFAIPEGRPHVPLGQIADIRVVTGPTMIKDEDGMLVGYVFVDIDQNARDIGSYVNEAKQVVRDEVDIPPGTHLKWTGQYELLESMAKRMRVVIPDHDHPGRDPPVPELPELHRDAHRARLGAVRARGQHLAHVFPRVQLLDGDARRDHRAGRSCRRDGDRHDPLSRPRLRGTQARGAHEHPKRTCSPP